MGLLARLFGRGKKAAPPTSEEGAEMIRVYDAYGREMLITREQWRQNVLPGNLQQARNNPDELYNMLAGALQDGFVQDIVAYAEHLQQIEPHASRAATLLGVVYLELRRLDEAGRVLHAYLDQHGEDGYVLSNLAKVYSARGEQAQAAVTLWRALEVDPNQENGLLWFEAIEREKSGPEAGQRALEKVAALPGSWRAQLWLARRALESGDQARALALYNEVLAKCPPPAPGDLLMQMTGDLGNQGLLVELLRLANPHFDAAAHGLQVGNNLIKANVDLGRVDHARAILDQLYALKRPDYQETLAYWDTEIAKARTTARADSIASPAALAMLRIQGAIWLDQSQLAAELAPAKDADAVGVCFLGASAEKEDSGEPRLQMADTAGRLSRMLPLYLCEQIHLQTTACGEVLQPYFPGTGFVLSGQAWSDEAACSLARQCDPPADYVAVSHFELRGTPTRISACLVRTIDESRLEEFSVDLDDDHLEPAFTRISEQLRAAVCRHTAAVASQDSSWYEVPTESAFNNFQLRLEQALAIKLAGSDVVGRDFLSGEREILMGILWLCLDQPLSIPVRALLARTLELTKIVAPHLVSEVADKVRMLQKDYPLPKPHHELLDKAIRNLLQS